DCSQLFKRNPEQDVHHVEEDTPPQGEPDQDVFCSLKTLIKINGEPLTAVVDTGAACSVITKDLVDRLGLRIDSVHGRILVTADGTRHNTAGAIDKLPIELKNRILPTRFAVFNRPGEQLILGMNWLRNHKIIVDMENNRLWLPHDRLQGKYFTVHVQDKHRSNVDQIMQILLDSDSEDYDDSPIASFSARPFQSDREETEQPDESPDPMDMPIESKEEDMSDNECDIANTRQDVWTEWLRDNHFPGIKP
ncbi:hypothetical protein BGZ59_005185, partial [Podila verticillata]